MAREGKAPAHVGYRFASEDLEDIRRADVVICFTEEPRSNNSRGGRHVEFGYALGLGKTIVIVGPRENVFYCIRNERIAQYETWRGYDDDEDEWHEGAWDQIKLLNNWHRRFAEIFQGAKSL